jgi:hypothetical protein
MKVLGPDSMSGILDQRRSGGEAVRVEQTGGLSVVF